MDGVLKNLFYIAALTSLNSCKPPLADRKSDDSGRKQFSDLYATSQTELRNRGNYYYALFKKDYDLNLDRLPKSGTVDTAKTPYTGSWYPQKSGGTSRDSGNGNVLQKYDKAFHNAENKAVQWEQDHHTVSTSDPSAGWAGHCNGYSAAASRHAEPKKTVKRGDVEFFPKDIKALLAEIHMAAKFYFLGGNRCGAANSSTLTSPGSREDPFYMGECDDVNPATFHTAFTNWVGIQKHPIIVDISSKEQVWNYPHFKYESTIETVTASQASQLIRGVEEPTYRFNSSAKGWRKVTTKVYYSHAYEKEYLQSELKEADKIASKTYTYILELDAEGRIIGGEWTGESIQSHPDFLWVAFEPVLGDGNANSANPNISPDEVIKLWAESVDQDPNNPTLDIKEPTIGKEWGRFPKFDISINSGRSGSVFLGLPQTVLIERKEELHGDATVDLVLDGKSVIKKTMSGSDNLSAPLDFLSPGIHVLEIKWVKSNETVDFQRVKIHAI